MTINSDKENKQNPNLLTKLWNSLFGDLHRTLIITLAPILTYFLYINYPDETISISIGAIAVIGIIGLFTEGELFKDYKSMAWLYNIILVIVFGLWYSVSYTEEQKDTMDLKPYITSVTASEDKTMFKINMKLPFEKSIETGLNYAKYQPLFASKEHFSEFTIEAVKTCYKYRFKSVDCSTKMVIKHQSVGESIYETSLKDSVYPKKLQFEIDQEKEDSK